MNYKQYRMQKQAEQNWTQNAIAAGAGGAGSWALAKLLGAGSSSWLYGLLGAALSGGGSAALQDWQAYRQGNPNGSFKDYLNQVAARFNPQAASQDTSSKSTSGRTKGGKKSSGTIKVDPEAAEARIKQLKNPAGIPLYEEFSANYAPSERKRSGRKASGTGKSDADVAPGPSSGDKAPYQITPGMQSAIDNDAKQRAEDAAAAEFAAGQQAMEQAADFGMQDVQNSIARDRDAAAPRAVARIKQLANPTGLSYEEFSANYVPYKLRTGTNSGARGTDSGLGVNELNPVTVKNMEKVRLANQLLLRRQLEAVQNGTLDPSMSAITMPRNKKFSKDLFNKLKNIIGQ